MKQTGFTPILLILLVSLVIGGAYYLGTQKAGSTGENSKFGQSAPSITNETANWKTYIDSKIGYSFKYPSELLTKDFSTATYTTHALVSKEEDKLEDAVISFRLNNNAIERSKSYLNYGDAGLQNKADNIEEFTVDGKKAYRAVVTLLMYENFEGPIETGKIYTVLIDFGDQTLAIDSKVEKKDLVDQIISTFEFTN